MTARFGFEIAGTGCGAPSRVVTNHDFAQRLDTSDEWIVQRTGIRERRFAGPDENTLTMSTAAARQALEAARLDPKELQLIVHATITPAHPLPSTACELQAALGCEWIPAFDIAAACSGFVYALATAAQFMHSGMYNNVLVIGSETLTRVTNQEDRSTAVLFGDGAGAAVLRKCDSGQGILSMLLGADGYRAKAIWIPAGGSEEPASDRTVNEKLHGMRMNGREIYKFAVTQMHDVVRTTADDAGVALDDIKLVIPHQSNQRIIESARERLGIPAEKVLINIDRYGNTSAASIPIGLHESVRDGRIQRGDLVMLAAFGAGLTWASALIRF